MSCQKLCTEDCAAGCTPNDIVRETDKFIIKEAVLSEPAHADAHTPLIIHIQSNLRTVVIFQVLDKLLGSTWQIVFLGQTSEVNPAVYNLLFGGLFVKVYKDCGRMSIEDRDADTLGGDEGTGCLLNMVTHNLSKDSQRFLLGLLWCVTVIGIPFGLQCFKLAKLSLAPFGAVVVFETE